MSDPYREVTKRHAKGGLSPLGWFLVVVFGFAAVGLAGVVGVGFFVAKQASEVIADFKENPVEAFVDLADAAGDDIEVVSRDDEDGTVTLRVRDTGDLVSVDLSEVPKMLGGGQDQTVRFDGEADESGGVLTVRTPDGETRIELRGNEEGGFLHISTPDDEVHLGAGAEASGLPDWVPLVPGSRLYKRLFSAETDEGRVGAVLVRIDDDPETVMSWYQERMPDLGFVVSTSRVRRGDGEFKGKIEWTARGGGEEREVSIALGEDDDGEGFLFLFYRDRR